MSRQPECLRNLIALCKAQNRSRPFMKEPNFEENSIASTALTEGFRIFVFLCFCRFDAFWALFNAFLYFFLSVFLTLCLSVLVHFFSSSHFTSLHCNLLGSLQSPFYCIFVFLSFCLLCLSVLVCLSSSLIRFSSY